MTGYNNPFGGTNSFQSTSFGSPSGQNTTALGSGNPFGSATGTNGTAIKFNPVVGTDTMIHQGVNSLISIRHQCITLMKEYETKSQEELMFEDYQSNRKGPQPGALEGFGAAQPSLFGNGAATPTTGLNEPLSGFANPFGATVNTSSVFGQPMPQQNNSPFGAAKPMTFGTPVATTAGSSLNFNHPAGGANNFGSTSANQNKSMFRTRTNQPAPGELFWSTVQQPSTSFGSEMLGATPFTTQNQAGIFGNKTGFGATTTAPRPFSFVNPTNTTVPTANPFGAKPNSGFGATGSTFGGLNAGISNVVDAGEEARTKCIVCLLQDRNTLMLPCAHAYFCTICSARVMDDARRAQAIPRCPFCRHGVTSTLRIFL